jgi:PIN domain nuclease of toxin-antitoxin system
MPVRLPTGTIVADASFLIGVAENDQRAVRFAPAFPRLVVTSVNFGEVLYKLHQKAGIAPTMTEAVMVSIGVVVEAVELAHVRHFADLKQIDAASRQAQEAAGVTAVRSLSSADMTCLGYAWERRLPVLTGDRHWRGLPALGLGVKVYDFRDRNLRA